MQFGDISNEGSKYVFFQFKDLIEETEPLLKVFKRLRPEHYWRPTLTGRRMLENFIKSDGGYRVHIIVYEPILDKAIKFLDDNFYEFHKIIQVDNVAQLDYILNSSKVTGLLTKNGKDGFGRARDLVYSWDSV